MKEEIFGPLLPVISFDNLDDVISKVKKKEKPLALYIYSKNKKIINKINTFTPRESGFPKPYNLGM